MVAKSVWAKSTNGPDWTDVEMMMRAISGLHSGDVALIVSPDGIGSTGGLDVRASIIFSTLPGSSLPPNVQVAKKFPCITHSSLEGLAYSLLFELDFQIGKTYKNETLWK